MDDARSLKPAAAETALPDVSEVEAYVRTVLSEERIQHVLGVVQTAAELAERYGADPDKAALAAWLHDVAKERSRDELLMMADEFGIIFTDLEMRIPALWHAPVGTRLARFQFGLQDLDVLASIRFHTTGRPGMSLLEQIIFLADVIEPGRRFPDADQLRELSKLDLGRAMLAAFENKIVRIVGRGGLLHPDTVAARNDMLIKLG